MATIQALQVDNTEIITPCVGNRAFRSSAFDGVGVTLNASGQASLQAAGAAAALGVQRDEVSKYAGFWIKGSLVASDAAAGVLSEENTYSTDLIITRFLLFVTTPSTGACTIDIGQKSTEISGDDLLDGISVAAAGIADNIANKGTNGSSRRKWGAGEFVTGSMASGATAGLVGTYAIHVIDIN